MSQESSFNALSHEWWNENGALKTLHDINPVRLRYIKKSVNLTNKKILDIGCGGGLLTESMASCGGLVTGIDISKNLIQIATEHARETNLNITYICNTAEEFATTQQSSYDLITCMELLEHVADPISVIDACRKLIKPNGLLFLSTINRNWKAYLYTKILAEYLLRLLPVGTHEYAQYNRPSEVAAWCRTSNFTVVDISGMAYIPFLRTAYIHDNPHINYLLCAQAC